MSANGKAAIVELVQGHPFFEGVDPTLVAAMVSKAEERTYNVGDMLVREGKAAEEFFLVFEGKIALEVGASDQPGITVETIGRGEILGWSWLVSPHRWRFDARALKPTRVVALNAAAARYALAAHPAFGYQFLMKLLPVIADRLENTRVQLMDIHGV